MPIITDKINKILKDKNLTYYQISKIIDFDESALNKMTKGKIHFSSNLIQKIAPILEVSPEEIRGWILADKYPKEVLERAIQLKKEKSLEDNRRILTIKLDEILKSRNLSRTGLSKLIKYSQGGLNEMIIGKEPMSKGVIQKISQVLDISEDEIRSWIVADKYSLEALGVAVKEFFC